MTYCSKCGLEIKDSENYCPECGSEIDYDREKRRPQGTDEDTVSVHEDENQSEYQSYPVLSVFAAVMLIWTGIWAYNSPASSIWEAAFFVVAGLLVTPRSRRESVLEICDILGRDITEVPVVWPLLRASVAAIYIFLVFAAALLMIGEAANDPEMSAWAGVGSIIIAFIIAVVLVALSEPIERTGWKPDSVDEDGKEEEEPTTETTPETTPKINTSYDSQRKELTVTVEHPADADYIDVQIGNEVEHTFRSPEPGDRATVKKEKETPVSIKKRQSGGYL